MGTSGAIIIAASTQSVDFALPDSADVRLKELFPKQISPAPRSHSVGLFDNLAVSVEVADSFASNSDAIFSAAVSIDMSLFFGVALKIPRAGKFRRKGRCQNPRVPMDSFS
jgi:hypothetical protein